jgi:hypothetical protein
MNDGEFVTYCEAKAASAGMTPKQRALWRCGCKRLLQGGAAIAHIRSCLPGHGLRAAQLSAEEIAGLIAAETQAVAANAEEEQKSAAGEAETEAAAGGLKKQIAMAMEAEDFDTLGRLTKELQELRAKNPPQVRRALPAGQGVAALAGGASQQGPSAREARRARDRECARRSMLAAADAEYRGRLTAAANAHNTKPRHSNERPETMAQHLLDLAAAQLVRKTQCKECGSDQICPHGRAKRVCQDCYCKECAVKGICEHGCHRSTCKVCSVCEHGRTNFGYLCKECGGLGICEHGRDRRNCKECGGSAICEHGRQRAFCKECGGSQICEHSRYKHKCKHCRAAAAGGAAAPATAPDPARRSARGGSTTAPPNEAEGAPPIKRPRLAEASASSHTSLGTETGDDEKDGKRADADEDEVVGLLLELQQGGSPSCSEEGEAPRK